MKLFDTALCVECDEVIDVGHNRAMICPSCTCTQLVYLSNFVAPIEPDAKVNFLRTMPSPSNRTSPEAA